MRCNIDEGWKTKVNFEGTNTKRGKDGGNEGEGRSEQSPPSRLNIRNRTRDVCGGMSASHPLPSVAKVAKLMIEITFIGVFPQDHVDCTVSV